MIYESRPNVTVDACGLALKSGNAIILRGSSSAFESNVVIVEILKNALKMSNISPDCIGFVYSKDREAVDELLSYTGIIDLVITPSIVYDQKGYRLGYGKGYYDKYFALNNYKTSIGLSYDKLLKSSVPIANHDRPVDIIITEEKTLVINEKYNSNNKCKNNT